MSHSRIRRGLALLAASGLLTTMAAVTAAPGYVPICDHYLSDGETLAVLQPGEIACGSAGAETITTMNGGTFYGYGGDDAVGTQNGGKFVGGTGDDKVSTQNDGVFKGLEGHDRISKQYGTFHAGPGDDRVRYLHPGARFDGGKGRDQVVVKQNGGTFVGGRGKDRVQELLGGVFKGGLGRDRARAILGGVFFGGADADYVRDIVGPGKFKAGPGPDTAVYVGWNALFNGEAGNDRITGYIYGSSTYNGGPGTDSAVICRYTANKLESVELRSWVDCL